MPDSSTASWNRLVRCEQTSTCGGSSETDVNALAVMAWSTPSITVVTTVTPLANRPRAPRNAALVDGLGHFRTLEFRTMIAPSDPMPSSE